MDREPLVGELVVITRNTGNHSMKIGERLIVCSVDTGDDTLQGMIRGARTAHEWIPWSDVEPVVFGWGYARHHLPEDVAEILAACDGIDFIALNPAIKDLILESLPDWRKRVSNAVRPVKDTIMSNADDQGTGDDDDAFVDDDPF